MYKQLGGKGFHPLKRSEKSLGECTFPKNSIFKKKFQEKSVLDLKNWFNWKTPGFPDTRFDFDQFHPQIFLPHMLVGR